MDVTEQSSEASPDKQTGLSEVPLEIRFVEPGYAPVKLAVGSALSEHLNVKNSPLLFGCRTGICGTCAIRVHASSPNAVLPPEGIEAEFLSEMASHLPGCRLACQMKAETHLLIEKVTL